MRPHAPIRPRRTGRTVSGRAAARLRRSIGADIRQLREDAGITQGRLADAAGIEQAHESRIESGAVEPSLSALSAIAEALGADLSVRLYPNTGPRIHDRNQARMVEALIRSIDPRWGPFVEVPITSPAKGVIDVVLHDMSGNHLVAVESESGLRRLEQQIRRHQEKAASLQSADLWRFASPPGDPAPRISRLLLLRLTRSTIRCGARVPSHARGRLPGASDRHSCRPDNPNRGVAWLRDPLGRDRRRAGSAARSAATGVGLGR